MNDTIFVIAPAYNTEKYIKDAFDSLIAQTYPNWQCLCMNDGSADSTFEIMQSYAKQDSRFAIFSQENKGLTKTLNILLDKVKDGFIYYLDSDDYIHPQTFETLMHFMHKTNADVVECSAIRVKDEAPIEHFDRFDISEIQSKEITDMKIFLSKKTQTGSWINKWNKLYRWRSVKDIRFSELLSHEDDYFYATLVNDTISKKTIIDKALYCYRINQNSMCNSLNFKRYQTAGINRIKLSYDYFVKGNRIPAEYIEDFKNDLSNDAYRMIIKKSLKKCPDKQLRKELFLEGSKAISDYISNGIIETKRLPILKRITTFFCVKRCYHLSRLFVYLG